MGHIADLGRRIELVSMDPHFHDISIALYEQQGADGAPAFLVHTYSGRDGAAERIGQIMVAMKVLGGMEDATAGPHMLRFPCGAEHKRACRRLFLEACKLAPGAAHEVRPMATFDKKSERTIEVANTGGGEYQVAADGEEDGRDRRISAIAGGLVKLAELETVDMVRHKIAFDCGHAHDALVGLLLVRALNVRAALREQESMLARGVLAAPSAQN